MVSPAPENKLGKPWRYGRPLALEKSRVSIVLVWFFSAFGPRSRDAAATGPARPAAPFSAAPPRSPTLL
jgi:hypothetical protein